MRIFWSKKILFSRTAVFILLFVICYSLFVTPIAAQQPIGQLGIEYGTATGLGTQDIRLTVARIIRAALGLIGIVMIVLIAYGGFMYMTAAGDEEKVDKGKKIIVNSIVGLAIILSSLAIVQFVISRLVAATTGVSGGELGSGGSGGAGTGLGLPQDSFYITSITPSGQLGIRNVTVRVTFSHPVNQNTVLGNTLKIRYYPGDRSVPEGLSTLPGQFTFSEGGRVVEFKPDASCPDAPEQKCFPEDTIYITVNGINYGGVDTNYLKRASDGKDLICQGISAPCLGQFRPGPNIDTTPPNVAVTFPAAGTSYCVGDEIPVYAQTNDEGGIAYVEFLNSQGNTGYTPDSIDAPVGDTPTNFTANRNWNTSSLNPTQLYPNEKVSVRAFDIGDPFKTSEEVNIILRPAQCCNGTADPGEAGVDAGGFCGGRAGGSCAATSDCGVGLSCVGGTCQVLPIISSIEPRDGAAGNYITIFGNGFGATQGAGTVTFFGDPNITDDDKVAAIAPCGGAWRNNSIIVVIPDGAASGPLEVKNNAGLADSSSDLGNLGIFTINNISRPGICEVNPTAGEGGDQFSVSGRGFGITQSTSTLFFGDRPSQVATWVDTILENVTVPNVQEGRYVLRAEVNGTISNGVYYTVNPPADRPTIVSLSPGIGGIGTYLTIYGTNFGSTPGSVTFIRGQDIADADISFPEGCSGIFWQDSNITVKVPPSYRDKSAIERRAHEIQVVRVSDGARSNTKTFTANDEPPGPSVCAIRPDNGPEGTQVIAIGERFGVEQGEGEARYYNEKAGQTASWSDGEVMSLVPPGATTGPVTVLNNEGVKSNSRNFRVADCRESACGAGEQCCGGSCILEGTACTAGPREGSLLWRIATGPLPRVPHVIEHVSCGTLTQSPSPFKNTQDACPNAQMAARFSELMDEDTFSSLGVAADTVKLEACGTGVEFDDDNCEEPINLGLILSKWALSSLTGTMLVITPPSLETTTWYRATFSEDLRSSEGVPLDAPYSWIFKTSAANCVMSKVEVTPYNATIIEQEGTQRYDAMAEAANCNILRCDTFGWDWRTERNPGIATISGTSACNTTDADPTNDLQYTIATGLLETGSLPPVRIFARANVLATTTQASTVSESREDYGNLEVNFLDPQVVAYWPNCQAACINAEIGAVFNTAMDETTINTATITLHHCTEESCRSFDEQIIPVGVEYLDEYLGERNVARLTLAENLRPNEFYVARVSKEVTSRSGVNLVGLNDGNLYFRWEFRTKNDTAACGVESVAVSPARAVVKVIGERVQFASTPRGSPDECNVLGQPLSPLSYSWIWESSRVEIGELYPMSEFNPRIARATEIPKELDPRDRPLDVMPLLASASCSNQCLNIGSSPNIAVCGNGVREYSEDCDDGGVVAGVDANGSGVIDTNERDGCSASCLHQVLPQGAWSFISISGTCGNGVLERDDASTIGEECDDGNVENGDGCSNECFYEGARPPEVICGNKAVGYGEECDDNNTISGDGCSAACLFEGSRAGISECGNSILERGEDCDDGNTAEGFDANDNEIMEPSERDGCSSRCLNQGSPVCTQTLTTNCCGDGVIGGIRIGEDCDDGNTQNNDGCSSQCLNEGSRLPRALCGDWDPGEAQTEVGEDCDSGTNDAGNANQGVDPSQYATAINGTNDPNTNSTEIRAATQGKTGVGVLSVLCNCEVDGQCNDGATNINACGNGSCCYVRPKVLSTTISQGSAAVCPNTAIGVTFDQRMNHGSFLGNLTLWEAVNLGATCPQGTLEAGSRTFPFGGFYVKLCAVETSVVFNELPDGTEARLQLGHALSISSTHILEVLGTETGQSGGVKSVNGAAMDGIYQVSFTTGPQVCGVSGGGGCGESSGVRRDGFRTEVSPDTHLFNSNVNNSLDDELTSPLYDSLDDSDKVFNAKLLFDQIDASGVCTSQELQSLPELDWHWIWSTPATASNVTSIQLPLRQEEGRVASSQVVRAGTENGETDLTASARITAPQIDDPSVDGSARITNFLCKNPWPAVNNFPFYYGDQNLSLYYCRDAGDPDSTEDDLPALNSGAGFASLTYDPNTRLADPYSVWIAAEAGILDEFLLQVNCDSTSSDSCKDGDAVGFRVFRNEEHEAPLDWFASQGFVGAPQSLKIDGYDAVSEGRSVYINAANIIDPLANIVGNIRVRVANTVPNSSFVTVSFLTNQNSRATLALFDRYTRRDSDFIRAHNFYVVLPRNIEQRFAIQLTTSAGGSRSRIYIYPTLRFSTAESREYTFEVVAPVSLGALPSFTNTYIISYNQNASLETTNIANQLVQNIQFNNNLGIDREVCGNALVCSNDASIACTPANAATVCGAGNTCGFKSCNSDLDCAGLPSSPSSNLVCRANKAKTTRNVKRLSDAVTIYKALATYRDREGQYPTLSSGSFIPGLSVSTWPSWQAAFGNALQSSVPTDPLNRFNSCTSPYASGTCWDNTALQFRCAARSSIYSYRIDGPTNYRLNIGLERLYEDNVSLAWMPNPEPPANLDPSATTDNLILSSLCTSSSPVFGASTRCGDGILGGTEVCEIDQTQIQACSVGGRTGSRIFTCRSDCLGFIPPPGTLAETCQVGSCGDGAIQAPERCDDGNLNGQYGRCPIDCGILSASRVGAHCGDGMVNGSEFCDRGLNEAGSGNDNGEYGSGCSWDCRNAGPRCGDNIINDGEACDGETQVSTNIDVTGPNNIPNGIDDVTFSAVCPDIMIGGTIYDQARARSCEADCTWPTSSFYGGWGDCAPQGTCGNGITESGEQCDDGNTDSADACVSCKNARCGDNFVRTGIEQCDNGASNGSSCTPSYGSSCSYCNAFCGTIQLTGPYCGDGVRHSSEACDNLAFESNTTCQTLGYPGGTLQCNTGCSSPTGGCKSCWEASPYGAPSTESITLAGRVVAWVCSNNIDQSCADSSGAPDDGMCASGSFCQKRAFPKVKVALSHGSPQGRFARASIYGYTLSNALGVSVDIIIHGPTISAAERTCVRDGGTVVTNSCTDFSVTGPPDPRCTCELKYNNVFINVFRNLVCSAFQVGVLPMTDSEKIDAELDGVMSGESTTLFNCSISTLPGCYPTAQFTSAISVPIIDNIWRNVKLIPDIIITPGVGPG